MRFDASSIYSVGEVVCFDYQKVNGERIPTSHGEIRSIEGDVLVVSNVRPIVDSGLWCPSGNTGVVKAVSAFNCEPEGVNSAFEECKVLCVRMIFMDSGWEMFIPPGSPVFPHDMVTGTKPVEVTCIPVEMLLSEIVYLENVERWNPE